MDKEVSPFRGENVDDSHSGDQEIEFNASVSAAGTFNPKECFLRLELFCNQQESQRSRNSSSTPSAAAASMEQHKFPQCKIHFLEDTVSTREAVNHSGTTEAKPHPRHKCCNFVTDLMPAEPCNGLPSFDRASRSTALIATASTMPCMGIYTDGHVATGDDNQAQRYENPSQQKGREVAQYVQEEHTAHPSTSQSRKRVKQSALSKDSVSFFNPASETRPTMPSFHNQQQQHTARASNAGMVIMKSPAPTAITPHQQIPAGCLSLQYHMPRVLAPMMHPWVAGMTQPGLSLVPASANTTNGDMLTTGEDQIELTRSVGGAEMGKSSTNAAFWAEESSSSIPKKRKPRDPARPKKPLSAYNIFFKEERAIMIQELESGKSLDQVESPFFADSDGGIKTRHGGATITTSNQTVRSENTSDDIKRQRKRVRLGISFEEMAKIIGKRWRNIHSDRLVEYRRRSDVDKRRYAKEMAAYTAKKSREAETAEALPKESISTEVKHSPASHESSLTE